MKLLLAFSLLCLLNTGCIKQEIHQGNVIDPNSIWIIQKGDTRFAVEAEMGPPVIKDPAHPQRVLYVEEVYDEEKGEKYTRSVAINYDEAWRVESIQRQGFE